MWRDSVVSASDRIFPGLAYYDHKKEFYDIGNQIRSNLPLQIALFCNVWLFPLWFIAVLASLNSKYYKLTDTYQFITVSTVLIVATLECVRLYLGYLGNLAEKIPELTTFWLVSTLLQFPLQMFLLLDENTLPSSYERLAHGTMILFLVIEIATGTIALRNSAAHHAKRFYLAQLYGIDDTPS